jgi:hypothetical protein
LKKHQKYAHIPAYFSKKLKIYAQKTLSDRFPTRTGSIACLPFKIPFGLPQPVLHDHFHHRFDKCLFVTLIIIKHAAVKYVVTMAGNFHF